jgi:RHS repeat-associated protein
MLNSSQAGGLLHYNHLNLPYKFQGGGTIEWLYDASGMKHQKKTTGGPPDENYTKDYILGIEYKDGQIESIMHPEGRAVWFDDAEDQEPGKFIYEYNLKDHLGNVRVVFADKDENGFVWPFYFHGAKGSWYGNNYQDNEDHEIIQENHYYPFGMAMEGAWEHVVPEVAQDYLYNGKEMQGDFGLDWLDYGARYYDAAIGRWNGVDLLSEDYYSFSAYNYVLNNPINSIDPDGMRVSIVGNDEYRTLVFNALINLALSSEAGAELVNNAFGSERTLVIGNTEEHIENQLDEWNVEERGYATLAFDIGQATEDLDASNGRNGESLSQTIETSLAHELAHFSSPQTGYLLDDKGYRSEIAAEEVYAVEMENRVRKEMGMKERTHYGGVNVHGKKAVESQKYSGYYILERKSNYASTNSGEKLRTPINQSWSALPDYKFTPMNVLRKGLKKPLPEKAWILSN